MRLLRALVFLPLLALPALAAGPEHKARAVGVALGAFDGLVTQAGRAFGAGDLKGRPSLVYFGYINCPSVCPTTLAELTAWLDAAGPSLDRLQVLFVTADPERDTPERLAEYLQAFHPRITALTGPRASVDRVALAVGRSVAKVEDGKGGYAMAHPYGLFLIDRYGLLAREVDPADRATLEDVTRRILAQ